MYLLEFLLRKSIRIGVPTVLWAAIIIVPYILAQSGALDFALIEGRCYRPLGKCGQDNISLVAFGIGALCMVPAIVGTIISVNWYEESWIEEREALRRKHQPVTASEPTRPNIYD